MRVPGRSPAIDETNTIAPPSLIRGNAARHNRKCARTLTANTASHCSTDVPSRPRPSPIPTLHTSPSILPSAATDSSITRAHVSFVGHVADDDRRGSVRRLDQARRLLRRTRIPIDARDRRTFLRREHRDRATVPHRCVGIVRSARARADHNDVAPGQSIRHHAPTVTGSDAGLRPSTWRHSTPERSVPARGGDEETNTERTASSNVIRASAAPRQ